MYPKSSAVYDVPGHHETLWGEQKTHQAEIVGDKGDKKAAGFKEVLMGEVFHSLYATTPTKVEKPARGAAVRKRIHDLIHELPEFETLRKQTVRDVMWSGMATTALCESVEKGIPEAGVGGPSDPDEASRILEGLKALQEQYPEADLQKHIDEAQKTLDGETQDMEDAAGAIDETAIRNAARNGIAAASGAIDNAEQAMNALGYGTGAGMSTQHRDPRVAIEIARRVASSHTLKKVIEIAGRLTATARAKRSSRTEYARSEMVGVEPTDKLQRILPSEMVNLATPMGTANLYRKLMERNAMGYKMTGNEKVGKGPLILVLDQSGSMMGDKDVWAKGIALALLDAARAEKRSFGFIMYDDGIRGEKLFLDPENVNPSEILDLLSVQPNGGTEFYTPIAKALGWIDTAMKNNGKLAKADIVHITDGDAGTDGAATCKAMAEKLGCTVYGIAIGRDSYGGKSLEAWSDTVTHINDVNKDTAAVDTIFDHV